MKDSITLKTSVDTKYIKTKLSINKVYRDSDQYMYRLVMPGVPTKDNTHYILKGYKIALENWNSKTIAMKFISQINAVYKEYYYFKIGSVFDHHLAKPLGIDYAVELSPSYLFIEIIFEEGGETLSKLGEIDIDLTYDLMKQSIETISLMQNVGVVQLDISANNFIYNKEKDLLKMLNAGFTKGFQSQDSELCDDLMRNYLPPEILQKKLGNAANTSVYSWAMTFYSMILGKSQDKLRSELKDFKMSTKEAYDGFISSLRDSMLTVKGDEAKRNVITEQLIDALNYDTKDRADLNKIRKELKAKESDVEVRHKKKLIELLGLENYTKASECVIEVSKGEVDNLMKLGNSMLKYLREKEIPHETIGTSFL